jgi:hypothetical protein
MVSLDAHRQKIESLTTTDRAFDVLSGGVVRLFARLEEIEIELRRHRERLRALEKQPGNSDDGLKVTPTSARRHVGNHQWRKPNSENSV